MHAARSGSRGCSSGCGRRLACRARRRVAACLLRAGSLRLRGAIVGVWLLARRLAVHAAGAARRRHRWRRLS